MQTRPVSPAESQTPDKRNQRAANVSAIGMILLSVFLSAGGQLLFKAAMNDFGVLELSIPALLRLLSNPLLLLGLAVFFISAVLWLVALLRADLSFAVPFLSVAYILVLLGSVVLFQENISLLRLSGFAVIILGLFVIARGEQRKSR
ncbi:MAG: multidrug resistance protein [Chloroflexi bacterium]|nr:multidrug resistance protein [Chloroflexota bacterium]